MRRSTEAKECDLCGLMNLEGTKHERRSTRKSAAGAFFEIEAANHSDRGKPSIGPTYRRNRLDRVGATRRADSHQQVEELRWPSSAPTHTDRGIAAESDQGHDLARGRGPHSSLCSGSILVWFDRDGMVAGPHHASRLRGAVGRGGGEAGERIRGAVGRRRKACRPEGDGRRHHGAGSSNPLPERDGTDGCFMTSVAAASKKAGRALKEFMKKAANKFRASKEKVREYRLFAKTKVKKDKLMAEMANIVDDVQRDLARAVEGVRAEKCRVVKYGKVARAKVFRLHETMKKLIPQIRYWLKTGWVARDKIISLHIPELYSIVRGKVGKTVEFG